MEAVDDAFVSAALLNVERQLFGNQRFPAAETPTLANAAMHGSPTSLRRGFMQPGICPARFAPPQNLRASGSHARTTAAARDSFSPHVLESSSKCDSKHA
jgi:hypothetical protein